MCRRGERQLARTGPSARASSRSPILLALLLCVGQAVADPPPVLSARTALVMDAWTGDVLYEKDARTPYAIASLTKIMTGVVVLEHAQLTDVVTVSKVAAETGESSCDLKDGEKLSVATLLRMALMRSGNDAAVALAVHVGGTVAGFAELMNRKAQELGLMQSHFTNPHGLDQEGHHQSAGDLANLTRYAMLNSTFAEIVATPELTIPRAGYKDGYVIKNTNHLLGTRPDCIGVKTGWTGKAGYCLVAAAQRGARRFIAVVMDSKERFQESDTLLNWAFDTYVERVVARAGVPELEVRVAGGATPTVPVAPSDTVMAVLRRDRPLPGLRFVPQPCEAPLEAGSVVGEFEFDYRGQVVRVPAAATCSLRRSFLALVRTWPLSGLLVGCLASAMIGVAALRLPARRPRDRPRAAATEASWAARRVA